MPSSAWSSESLRGLRARSACPVGVPGRRARSAGPVGRAGRCRAASLVRIHLHSVRRLRSARLISLSHPLAGAPGPCEWRAVMAQRRIGTRRRERKRKSKRARGENTIYFHRSGSRRRGWHLPARPVRYCAPGRALRPDEIDSFQKISTIPARLQVGLGASPPRKPPRLLDRTSALACLACRGSDDGSLTSHRPRTGASRSRSWRDLQLCTRRHTRVLWCPFPAHKQTEGASCSLAWEAQTSVSYHDEVRTIHLIPVLAANSRPSRNVGREPMEAPTG